MAKEEKVMSLKDQILNNIKSNGFPTKKVSLPLEKMYEVADTKGENLNTILDELKSQAVDHEKTADKIIFKSALPNLGTEGFEKAQEMMKNMGPEEMQKLQDQVANMSKEEKEKLMEQAKAMGLF
jgi:DNA integrity scanning protein DisA with diadenylate cyclase activity